MPFAWEEIKNIISDSIIFFESNLLKQINNSESYQNTLTKDEYNTSIEVNGLTINAKAYFRKSLPFEISLEKDYSPLEFLETKVVSFGFYGYNDMASILYYNNDNDFAIKLEPKDKMHEIILVKTSFKDRVNLKDENDKLITNQNSFKKNKTSKNRWKYYFKDNDRVRIPIIEFNIETNFSDIENTNFSTKNRNFQVETAYQRTAFIFNEKGAEMESESEFAVEEAVSEERIKPKKMFFDENYLIFIKRKDNKNPYFAMLVSNSELMKKE